MATPNIKKQNSFLRPAGAFFRRFHMLIFFIIVAGCLAVAVILINDTLSTSSSDQLTTSDFNAGTIDQTTLDRIQALHPSNQPVPAPTLPPGRVNPFAE